MGRLVTSVADVSRHDETITDDSGSDAGCLVFFVVVVVLLGFLVYDRGQTAGVIEVCGPCASETTCGPYTCKAGVEGWQKEIK